MLMIRVINFKILKKTHQNHHMIHHIMQMNQVKDQILSKKMVKHISLYQREIIQ